IGTKNETKELLKNLFENCLKPIVIDADGLNIISKQPEILNILLNNSILTPHPKEFDRLAGNSENSEQRHLKAKQFAQQYNVYIVLKGANTQIICPDGDCYFNSTGNPGMATAGSGDVLTGIILSLLAQGYSSLHASLLGVYIHGLAGDIATNENGMEYIIASDIIENLGKAFKKFSVNSL
ncbi:MAG: NAD(P)H-hydrate dehydratase, partial [Bacteroidetes bacterium CG02_land_8_20_14_3_00_31_25]